MNCFNKTTDNTHSLALNRFFFQPDAGDYTGQFLQLSDAAGQAQVTNAVNTIPSNEIIVDIGGTTTAPKFNSLVTALNYAATLSPSQLNPILIQVKSGVYVETAAVVIPDYVTVVSFNNNSVTIVLGAALPAGQAFFQVSTEARIEDLTISANGLADYAFTVTGSLAQMTCRTCNFLGATTANVFLDNSNTVFFVTCTFLKTVAATLYGIYVNAGFAYADVSLIIDLTGTNYTAGVYMLDSNAPSSIISNISRVSIQGAQTGILLDNSYVTYVNSELRNCTTGINVSNGSRLSTVAVEFQNVSTEVIKDSTSFYFSSSCFHDRAKFTVSDYNKLAVNFVETKEANDFGTHILGGRFIVGSRDDPLESLFGEGGTEVDDVYGFKYNGTAYTDVSSDMLPGNGVSVTLFDNLTAGIFYIGDGHQYSTVQFQVDTLFVIGTGSAVAEYWNGSAWTTLRYMTTQSQSPYRSYADNLFNELENQEVRFDLSALIDNEWQLTTVNGVNAYWTRFRITSTITTSPAFSNVRIIGNSTVIAGDGTLRHYGSARTKKILTFDLNLLQPTSAPPFDSDVWFSQNISAGRIQNSFALSDQVGGAFLLPTDIDSSSPVSMVLGYISDSTAASQSDFNFNLYISVFDAGDRIYLSAGAASGVTHKNEQSLSFTLTPNQTNGQFLVLRELSFYLPQALSANAQGVPSQLIVFTMERPGTDSNPNRLVTVQMSFYYISWRTSQISLV